VATGGDRVVSLVMGARKVLTSGTHLPERERAVARERGRVQMTGGVWLAAVEGRGARARGRWAARRDFSFSFFSISISYFYFYFFFLLFLLNHYLAIYILK
jgi:hypothetical protein